MIVVWRGRGVWTPWVGVGLLIGFLGLLELFGLHVAHGGALTHHAWPYAVPLAASGAVCVALGIDNHRAERDLDAVTGLRIDTGPRHSFYGLAIEHWGLAYFCAAGLVLAFAPF